MKTVYFCYTRYELGMRALTPHAAAVDNVMQSVILMISYTNS
jgi:hypothetical protein